MAFNYENGQLGIKNNEHWLSLQSLADHRDEPFYVYDIDAMKARLDHYKKCFPENTEIHYAMKANDQIGVLQLFANAGLGVDVVSGGELSRALEAGFKASQAVFSGVGKSKKEIRKAIELGVKQINVESLPELDRILHIAGELKKNVNVAIRINPDVNPDTHPYIKTGFRENKFGLDKRDLKTVGEKIKSNPEFVKWDGLTMHIGSQIREMGPFLEAAQITLDLFNEYRDQGFDLQSLDIGGGIGMSYDVDSSEEDEMFIEEFGSRLKELFKDFNGRLLTEPGRILTARFGMLLGQVQYVKETPYKNFVILNTGMHHLIRPSLYQAYHRILPLKESSENEKRYDVVGPICESTDVLGKERVLPEVREGDWLAIADAGAYGAVLATKYNGHELPEELAICEGQVMNPS